MLDNHILVFKEVADKKSFSRAAEALHLTQPAISLQIQALEEYYGARLFDRTKHRVTLTEAGNRLYPFASEILNLHESAIKTIGEVTGKVKGKLTIGASSTIGEYVLPRIIGVFNNQYPKVDFHLEIGNTEHIIKKLFKHSIDFGLIEGPVNEDNSLMVEKFIDDELVLIVSRGHMWARRKYVDPEDLLTQPLIVREEGSGTRQVMEEALVEIGLPFKNLNVVMELGSTTAVKAAVETGLGISFVSKYTIRKEVTLNLLHTLRLQDKPILRDFNLIYHPKKFKTHTAATFQEFLNQVSIDELF